LRRAGRRQQAATRATLADLATEGDFGRGTLQEVTATLEGALRERPSDKPGMPHQQLVQLVKNEGMKANLDAPIYALVPGRQGVEPGSAKFVAPALDVRTKAQLLEMLAKPGLK
jgi:hypothetical protein